MAQVQVRKSCVLDYLRFERTPNCETVKKTHVRRVGCYTVANKVPGKRPATFNLRLTFSTYPLLPWPDANQL